MAGGYGGLLKRDVSWRRWGLRHKRDVTQFRLLSVILGQQNKVSLYLFKQLELFLSNCFVKTFMQYMFSAIWGPILQVCGSNRTDSFSTPSGRRRSILFKVYSLFSLVRIASRQPRIWSSGEDEVFDISSEYSHRTKLLLCHWLFFLSKIPFTSHF